MSCTYEEIVSICDAHGVGLPVDCVEMVMAIVDLAAVTTTSPISSDRLAALEAAIVGVTQEMLDGGWNARSLSKYAKSLEDKIAANAQAASALTDAQLEAAVEAWFDCYESTFKERMRAALLAASMGGDPK